MNDAARAIVVRAPFTDLLLRLLVLRDLPAVSAELLEDKLLRSGALVLGRRVVAPLARLALELDDDAVTGSHG
jgi:hypothetical protein